MRATLTAEVERWPVAGAFTISRGAKTHVDVVLVTASAEGATGRGEATPIYYHGETAEGVAAAVTALGAVDLDRRALMGALPRGAARNAVDAALWDLAAKLDGTPAWATAGLAEPKHALTAFTISLGEPERMEADARKAEADAHPLLKLKLAGEGDLARVAAVRRGAPSARLIVDANEAWTGRDVAAEAAALLPYGVELIEQPVKAGEDHLLDGVVSPIPLCADESCQDAADLARCIGRYQAINIKLDKAGGLTAALDLAAQARAAGLDLMVGCMLSTSLGVAPAFLLAGQTRWVDLDGPLLLARDRPGGLRFAGGYMGSAAPGFWGTVS
ncbi:dipeptide epimerase [Sphingomonas naphthae]|uniref:Dipeptide epimerase n=1 Tax=Sphingomonas naphthae TaxID=1813468 RepID=A0ABY7TR65_9SPHN|nr:N-acetyl-D-Glu racemase DgcA [Sphingomonas naphthae]WCT75435.1 dipeptide epimerase [Sphingomonas naphthae]